MIITRSVLEQKKKLFSNSIKIFFFIPILSFNQLKNQFQSNKKKKKSPFVNFSTFLFDDGNVNIVNKVHPR